MAREDVQAFLAQARGGAGVAQAKVLTLDELSARTAQPQHGQARFSFEAMRGRLLELSASGASGVLSAATGLVLEAQQAQEPVAWVTFVDTSFYPPDVSDSGVDLAALVVVRVPDVGKAARAAEQLLRSGAFGLVIVDLAVPDRVLEVRSATAQGPASERKRLPLAVQGRLVTLAQQQQALVVCLTEKRGEQESLGSMVSLRVEALRERKGEQVGVTLHALKDKRHGPGWSQHLPCRVPAGLK